MNAQKFIFVFLAFLFCQSQMMLGQAGGFPCNYDWTPGRPMKTYPESKVPVADTIKVGPGAQVFFSVRFADPDSVTTSGAGCSNGSFEAECQPFGHEVTFTTSNVMKSSFDAVGGGIGMVVKNTRVIAGPGMVDTFSILSSDQAELFTAND